MAGDAPCYHAAALCNAALIETSIPPCQYAAAALSNVATSRPALDSIRERLWLRRPLSCRRAPAKSFQSNFSNHLRNINTLIPIKHLTSVCAAARRRRRKRAGTGEFPPERLHGGAFFFFLMNLMKSRGSSRGCDRQFDVIGNSAEN